MKQKKVNSEREPLLIPVDFLTHTQVTFVQADTKVER